MFNNQSARPSDTKVGESCTEVITRIPQIITYAAVKKATKTGMDYWTDIFLVFTDFEWFN